MFSFPKIQIPIKCSKTNRLMWNTFLLVLLTSGGLNESKLHTGEIPYTHSSQDIYDTEQWQSCEKERKWWNDRRTTKNRWDQSEGRRGVPSHKWHTVLLIVAASSKLVTWRAMEWQKRQGDVMDHLGMQCTLQASHCIVYPIWVFVTCGGINYSRFNKRLGLGTLWNLITYSVSPSKKSIILLLALRDFFFFPSTCPFSFFFGRTMKVIDLVCVWFSIYKKFIWWKFIWWKSV